MGLLGPIASLIFGFLGTFLLAYSLLPEDDVYQRRQRLGLAVARTRSSHSYIQVLHPFFSWIGPTFCRLFPLSWQEKIDLRLLKAGLAQDIDPGQFMASKIVLPLLFLLAWSIFRAGSSSILGAGLSLFFFFLPDLWLWRHRLNRSRKLLHQLPFAMDLLTLSVEAGLDFAQAMDEVAKRIPQGCLTDELQLTLKQMRLGMTRAEALRMLARRVDLPEISTLTSVLVQADRLGSSIGAALRAQSESLRTKRYQRAEEMGAAAAQKILVPLILLILPAVIILIFGSVGLSLMGG